jgi:hypothetical protein
MCLKFLPIWRHIWVICYILSSSMAGKTSCVGKSDEGLFEHTFSTTISASYV